jgi:hypothetical protein
MNAHLLKSPLKVEELHIWAAVLNRLGNVSTEELRVGYKPNPREPSKDEDVCIFNGNTTLDFHVPVLA